MIEGVFIMNIGKKFFKNGTFIYSIGVFRLLLSFYFYIIAVYFYDTILAKFIIALCICTLISFLDILDGDIARHIWRNFPEKVNKYRCFDGVIDKLSITIATIGLMQTGRLTIVLFIFLILRELTVMVLGIIAFIQDRKDVIRGSKSGKLYYIVIMTLALLLYPENTIINSNMIININIVFTIILVPIAFMNYKKHIYNYSCFSNKKIMDKKDIMILEILK